MCPVDVRFAETYNISSKRCQAVKFGVFFDWGVETSIDVLINVAEGMRWGERISKGVDGERGDGDCGMGDSVRGSR